MGEPRTDNAANGATPTRAAEMVPARRHRVYNIDQAAELWGTTKEAVRDIAKRRPAGAPIAWPKTVTPFKDWVFDADRLDALVTAKYLERGELAPTPPRVETVAEIMLPPLPGAETFPALSRFAAPSTSPPAAPVPSPLDDPDLRKDMALAEARESGRAEGTSERTRLEQLVELKNGEIERLSEETERLREAISALVKPANR